MTEYYGEGIVYGNDMVEMGNLRLTGRRGILWLIYIKVKSLLITITKQISTVYIISTEIIRIKTTSTILHALLKTRQNRFRF